MKQKSEYKANSSLQALDLILLGCWTLRRVEPRYNESLHNEVLALTNDILAPSNNEPLYGYFRRHWSRGRSHYYFKKVWER